MNLKVAAETTVRRSDLLTSRILTPVVILVAVGVLLTRLNGGQVAPPQAAGDGLVTRVVQPGMIVAYCGQDLPRGYVWADGSTNWPNDSWVPMPLRGTPVPNLNGQFLRGTTDLTAVGTHAGHDSVAGLTTANDGAHTHTYDLPSKTGRITEREQGTGAGGGDYGHGYDVVVSSGAYQYGYHLPYNNGATGQGNHAHYLDGGTRTTPGGQGQHQHTIPAFSTIPEYVAVRYIIRVK
jgi:hypothetical protein